MLPTPWKPKSNGSLIVTPKWQEEVLLAQKELPPDERHALDAVVPRQFFGLERNPEPLHPVFLHCDNTASMLGDSIDELNRAVRHFASDIKRDPIITGSIAVCIVGFRDSRKGGPAYELLTPLSRPESFTPPTLTADVPVTPHCQLVSEVIPLIGRTMAAIRRVTHSQVRRGWLLSLSDGEANDLDKQRDALHATGVLAPPMRIEAFFFGVGDSANMPFLQRLSQPERPARHLRSVEDFATLFRWLHHSMRSVSQAIAGESIELRDCPGDGPGSLWSKA